MARNTLCDVASGKTAPHIQGLAHLQHLVMESAHVAQHLLMILEFIRLSSYRGPRVSQTLMSIEKGILSGCPQVIRWMSSANLYRQCPRRMPGEPSSKYLDAMASPALVTKLDISTS